MTGRMALAWAVALAAGGAGCGPKPVYRTAVTPERRTMAPPAVVARSDVAAAAQLWLGTPYRYGGYDRRGIDCSALAQNILGDLGATLPRTVENQRMQGSPVDRGRLEAGDLVFFRLGSGRVNHVGVMLDRNRFVHSSSSRGVVVDLLMDDYFARNFADARRVVGRNR